MLLMLQLVPSWVQLSNSPWIWSPWVPCDMPISDDLSDKLQEHWICKTEPARDSCTSLVCSITVAGIFQSHSCCKSKMMHLDGSFSPAARFHGLRSGSSDIKVKHKQAFVECPRTNHACRPCPRTNHVGQPWHNDAVDQKRCKVCGWLRLFLRRMHNCPAAMPS